MYKDARKNKAYCNHRHKRKRIQQHVTKHDNTNWTIEIWGKNTHTLFFFYLRYLNKNSTLLKRLSSYLNNANKRRIKCVCFFPKSQ